MKERLESKDSCIVQAAIPATISNLIQPSLQINKNARLWLYPCFLVPLLLDDNTLTHLLIREAIVAPILQRVAGSFQNFTVRVGHDVSRHTIGQIDTSGVHHAQELRPLIILGH